jgi:flagellin
MRINTNVTSLNVLGTLRGSAMEFGKSVGRLSSGFRINSAADDAAGLGIANKLRSDVRSLGQASRNAEQATSVLQVAEGGVQTISNILDRMKELATQAGSDNTDDAGRAAIRAEFTQLQSEITAIADTTKFSGRSLLDGTFGNSVDSASTALAAGTGVFEARIQGAAAGTYTITQTADGSVRLSDGTNDQLITGVAAGRGTLNFASLGITLELDANFDNTAATGTADGTAITVDAGAGGGSFLVRSSGDYNGQDVVSITGLDLQLSTLGLDDGSLTITGSGTGTEWRDVITEIDTAISTVNTAFGNIGAAQNRIDYARENTSTAIENFSAAESVIRDVDMAAEVTRLTKFQILQQAGQAMLGQANSAPQGVLRLLG